MTGETDIKLYSTLSRRLEPLEPGPEGVVRIYACRPTVYAPIHIGNARPFVVFMVLKRFLERLAGIRVRLVMNLTDVNDKIYAAALGAGVPSAELAEEMSRRYVADTVKQVEEGWVLTCQAIPTSREIVMLPVSPAFSPA